MFSGAALVILWPWDHDPAAALTVAGVALSTVAIVVTYAWYRPADRGVRTLSPEVAPSEAQVRMHVMAQFHAVRTAFYAAGFVCFVLAVVLT